MLAEIHDVWYSEYCTDDLSNLIWSLSDGGNDPLQDWTGIARSTVPAIEAMWEALRS
jgi:hypothetical protein